jgi:SAM-dependent methyltransferase
MAVASTGAAVQAGERPSDYYQQVRPEVAQLVPPRCRRVLDVGCAGGQLGRLLEARGHEVTGIELLEEASAEARHWLSHVVTLDVEREGFPFPPASFDAIIFADILEHLVDPWRVLRQAVPLLAADGVVIASIPNVQNLDIVWRLARGRWDYRERGILDRGHLRFFTLTTIHDLFASAGLAITYVGHRSRRSLWRQLLSILTGGRARALFTRQYLVKAERSHLVADLPASW